MTDDSLGIQTCNQNGRPAAWPEFPSQPAGCILAAAAKMAIIRHITGSCFAHSDSSDSNVPALQLQ